MSHVTVHVVAVAVRIATMAMHVICGRMYCHHSHAYRLWPCMSLPAAVHVTVTTMCVSVAAGVIYCHACRLLLCVLHVTVHVTAIAVHVPTATMCLTAVHITAAAMRVAITAMKVI